MQLILHLKKEVTAINILGKDFAAIKVQCFRGVAKINFKVLNFKHLLARKYYYRLFKKKVIVLKNIFKRINCN